MKISAFVDTNIFYDYPNLDQIKWLEVLKADHVLIVLPPVIFRELNDHKDSGRKPHLAGRAASTLLNLDRFFDSHPDDNTVPVRDGVDLFGDCQDAPVNPPLNPLIGDDPLIANILMYQTNHPDERVVLITDDRGLKLKARGCGVTCVKLPIEYKTRWLREQSATSGD